MVNEHGQIVCDSTKIILNDKKTIYPGYIEVKGKSIKAHYSDDPNNTLPLQGNLGILRNRLKGDNGEKYLRTQKIEHSTGLPQKKTFHFRDMNSLDIYQRTNGKE